MWEKLFKIEKLSTTFAMSVFFPIFHLLRIDITLVLHIFPEIIQPPISAADGTRVP